MINTKAMNCLFVTLLLVNCFASCGKPEVDAPIDKDYLIGVWDATDVVLWDRDTGEWGRSEVFRAVTFFFTDSTLTMNTEKSNFDMIGHNEILWKGVTMHLHEIDYDQMTLTSTIQVDTYHHPNRTAAYYLHRRE